MAQNAFRDNLIKEYFHMGFNYDEILDCLLLNNEIRISLRQLKRVLARNNLGRRRFSSFDEILAALQNERKHCWIPINVAEVGC